MSREHDITGAVAGITNAIKDIGHAITAGASPGHDETGGFVCSLTEATMGVTAGLCRVAEAINNLAEAVRERGSR